VNTIALFYVSIGAGFASAIGSIAGYIHARRVNSRSRGRSLQRREDAAVEYLAGAIGMLAREVRVQQATWPLPVRWVNTARPVTHYREGIHGVPGRIAPLDLSGQVDEIVKVFARVPSHRLVVLGGPGAGKTVLVQKLVSGLLEKRRPGDRVPVLLRVASWNPDKVPFKEWLLLRLADDYPALSPTGSGKTLARRMVDDGRIIPVLDGLDEMPERLRPRALIRLNDDRSLGDDP